MKKILIAQFKHETNCFSPFPTVREDFEKRNCLWGKEMRAAFQGVRNESGAFLDFFADKGEYELIPVCALDAMPQGKVAQAVFDEVAQALLAAWREHRPDGILLSLHGAMVTESSDDGEGALLSLLRAETGPDLPIVASLDLHANLTPCMMKQATALFGFHLYPHTDMYETGYLAAKTMYGILEGTLRPVMAYRRIPMLLPAYMTDLSPIREMIGKMRGWEKKTEVLHANVLHGFYSADIAEEGAFSLVVTNGDRVLAERLAEALAQETWDKREEFVRDFVSPEEAIAAVRADRDAATWVLADVSDNPGGGAAEDTTHVLKKLVQSGIERAAVAAICDPETVRQAAEAGCGARIPVKLGGRTDPAYSGGPLEAEAYVERLSDGRFRNRDEMGQNLPVDLGPTALLRIEKVQVIVISKRVQTWDAEIFRHVGIVPQDARVLVVKSAAHFQNSFRKITDAAHVLFVAAPGFAAPTADLLSFTKVPRPVWPLDPM